jgi:hypothetical protein
MCHPTAARACYRFTLLREENCNQKRYAFTTSMRLSAVSSTVTTTIGKAFLIVFPAVIAGSLLLNDRLICPSTRNRNRSSMGRAWLFCFSAAGCSDFVNVGRASIAVFTSLLLISRARASALPLHPWHLFYHQMRTTPAISILSQQRSSVI